MAFYRGCGAGRSRRLVLFLLVASFIGNSPLEGATPTAKVRFYMNVGTVEIELYGNESPINVANFLNYVDGPTYGGSYDNSIIHRTRTGATIAGSSLFAQGGSFKYNSIGGIVTAPAVNNEFNAANGLSNVQYTLAAALTDAGINTATSGWFINQTNNASAFDPGKYTIMGKVTSGTSIIDTIPFMQNLPVLSDTFLASMPIFVSNGTTTEVIINRAVRIPLKAGDFDSNGTINANDYVTWRRNFGLATNTSSSTGNPAADANGNGGVDLADYVTWRKAIKAFNPNGAGDLGESDVPEPSSGALILLGGLLVTFRRSRLSARRRHQSC